MKHKNKFFTIKYEDDRCMSIRLSSIVMVHLDNKLLSISQENKVITELYDDHLFLDIKEIYIDLIKELNEGE